MFVEINIVVHRNQHFFVRTKQGLKFVLDYILGDPREEKQSCTQNFIPFNCYLHFSLLRGCWGWSKILMWFLNPWSFTIRLWFYKLFVHSRTVSLQLEDNDAWTHSFDNFPHTTNLWPCVENCQNYILIHHCSTIAGRFVPHFVFYFSGHFTCY